MLIAPVQPTSGSVQARMRQIPAGQRGRTIAGTIAQRALRRVEELLLDRPNARIRHLPMYVTTVRVCAGAAARPEATDTDEDVAYAAWCAVQFAVRIAADVAEARVAGSGAGAEAAAWAAADRDLDALNIGGCHGR